MSLVLVRCVSLWSRFANPQFSPKYCIMCNIHCIYFLGMACPYENTFRLLCHDDPLYIERLRERQRAHYEGRCSFLFRNSKLLLITSSYYACLETRPRGYKIFSCSTQLNTKFRMLINTQISTNEEVSCFKSRRCCIYHAHKC